MKKPSKVKSKSETSLELRVEGLERKIEALLERVIVLQHVLQQKVDQGPYPRLFGSKIGTRY